MREENSRPTTDDQKTEQYIYRKIAESAEAYREKLDADPSLAHIQVTDEMRADMMRRIAAIKAESAAQEDAALERDAALENIVPGKNAAQENVTPKEKDIALGDIVPAEDIGNVGDPYASDINLLSEEDKHALEIGRKVLHVKKRSKVWRRLGLVAILALGVFGISMTSSANRRWILNMWNQMMGKEKTIYADNWQDIETYDADMQRIFSEIQEKTGIHAIQLNYIPKGLIFDNYTINQAVYSVKLFYQYNDTILTIYMVKGNQQTARGYAFDGDMIETIEVENPRYGVIEVQIISAPKNEKDCIAEFVYDDCSYTIYGALPQDEFMKMIEKLQIF